MKLVLLVAALAMLLILPGTAATAQTTEPPLQLMSQPDRQGTMISELHDIEGPIDLPTPVPYPLYLAIGLGLVLLLAALWWWYRWRRRPQAVVAIPAGVAARDQLMLARELMQPEQATAYMSRISSILRSYLEARFGLAATSQTTREFFATLPRRIAELPELLNTREQLQLCLERCDLVKFAHQPATLGEMQQAEANVLDFINTTEEKGGEGGTGGSGI